MNDEKISGPLRSSYHDAHGVEIFTYEWAAAEPIGVVQIAHGLGEHALRYSEFALRLVAAGFSVFADDHRGHGETGRAQYGGDLTKLGKLGPGGLVATEAAILQFTGIIRDLHPDIPVFAFGQSWGSLMLQRLLNENPLAWDGVIFAGSTLRTFKHLESGNLNAKWAADDATGFEWLSRDPSAARAFLADPLCFYADALKLFGFPDTLRLLGRPGAGLSPKVPLLMVSGSEDPLSRAGGVRHLADHFRARGVVDVTLKLYPGARHEVLNETNKEEAIADIITWLLDRVDTSIIQP